MTEIIESLAKSLSAAMRKRGIDRIELLFKAGELDVPVTEEVTATDQVELDLSEIRARLRHRTSEGEIKTARVSLYQAMEGIRDAVLLDLDVAEDIGPTGEGVITIHADGWVDVTVIRYVRHTMERVYTVAASKARKAVGAPG